MNLIPVFCFFVFFLYVSLQVYPALLAASLWIAREPAAPSLSRASDPPETTPTPSVSPPCRCSTALTASPTPGRTAATAPTALRLGAALPPSPGRARCLPTSPSNSAALQPTSHKFRAQTLSLWRRSWRSPPFFKQSRGWHEDERVKDGVQRKQSDFV